MKPLLYSLSGKRVWVAGHKGMVGSALVRRLEQEDCEIITATRDEVDLIDAHAVHAWMVENKPDAVFVAAAKVGGIHANNTMPADFLYDNLQIATNIIHNSKVLGVEKLLFLGSSCIYPRLAPQPMKEEALLTGPLEPTNEWYAIAKIAGIKMCQAYRQQYGCDYISAMPTNLYGPDDNFHPENSHVPAALLRRFHEAKITGQKEVVVWGTGKPKREFLFVDDLADACVFLMKEYSDGPHVNIGCGKDISIAEFAQCIKDATDFEGSVNFDTSRADGMPLKCLDVSRMTNLGWTAKTNLKDGLLKYYDWFLKNIDKIRE